MLARNSRSRSSSGLRSPVVPTCPSDGRNAASSGYSEPTRARSAALCSASQPSSASANAPYGV